MRRTQKLSHVQYDIEYHIVWITKYRYRVLQGAIAERLRYLIRKSFNSMKVTIISGSICKERIHILVSCPPSLSVSKFVQQLKGKTSRTLQMEFRELKTRYWGQYLWASGYFCRSVGTVTNKIIKDYIENQQDESLNNFKIID
uniref:IS200/IS605 family transposase n=1 Tax=Candidatus Ventrenecus sp. TaxID=3085654 RepID=UPI003FEFB486